MFPTALLFSSHALYPNALGLFPNQSFIHHEALADPPGTGLDQADNLNIEAFLEATEDGKPCYETLGFIYMGTRFWRTGKQNPSQQWEEMERYLQMPVPTHLMWRPKGGRFVEGETVLPWEVEE